MELATTTTSAQSLALGSRTSVLAERALARLADGPVDPVSIVRDVCQIPTVPSSLADHLAAALLAGDSRFTRRLDGWWELAIGDTSDPGMSSIHQSRYVVVDVETTGTRITRGDRITEVAVVEVCDGTSRVVFDSLINPERAIPPFIASLTNISWEMVRAAPRFADIATQLAAVLDGNIFVAHNAAFDWRFISMEMERATGRPLAGTRLCTVRMIRRLLPTVRRRSLDAIAAFYGIGITARHRAGGDAVATAKVLLRLLHAAGDLGLTTLDELESHLRIPIRARSRRIAMPHSVSFDPTS